MKTKKVILGFIACATAVVSVVEVPRVNQANLAWAATYQYLKNNAAANGTTTPNPPNAYGEALLTATSTGGTAVGGAIGGYVGAWAGAQIGAQIGVVGGGPVGAVFGAVAGGLIGAL